MSSPEKTFKVQKHRCANDIWWVDKGKCLKLVHL